MNRWPAIKMTELARVNVIMWPYDASADMLLVGITDFAEAPGARRLC